MKLFDTLLGRMEHKKPTTETLFALSTAYISLEALGLKQAAYPESALSRSNHRGSLNWRYIFGNC